MMMLSFLRRLDNVLPPPPVLWTDPFPLDDILDVSILQTKFDIINSFAIKVNFMQRLKKAYDTKFRLCIIV